MSLPLTFFGEKIIIEQLLLPNQNHRNPQATFATIGFFPSISHYLPEQFHESVRVTKNNRFLGCLTDILFEYAINAEDWNTARIIFDPDSRMELADFFNSIKVEMVSRRDSWKQCIERRYQETITRDGFHESLEAYMERFATTVTDIKYYNTGCKKISELEVIISHYSDTSNSIKSACG